jgi:hypothetical protein
MITFYYSLDRKVPDYEVSMSIKQQKQQMKMQQSLALPPGIANLNEAGGGSSSSPQTTERTGYSGGTHQSGSESERIRQCGSLFYRRATMNQELLDEFFRRESCPYSKLFSIFLPRFLNFQNKKNQGNVRA